MPIYHTAISESLDAFRRQEVLCSGAILLKVVRRAWEDVRMVDFERIGAPKDGIGTDVVVASALFLQVQERLVRVCLRLKGS